MRKLLVVLTLVLLLGGCATSNFSTIGDKSTEVKRLDPKSYEARVMICETEPGCDVSQIRKTVSSPLSKFK